MKKYYYVSNNEKKGPLNIEDLRKLGLSKDTLIWYNGLEKWTMLKNIPELNVILKEYIKYYVLEDNKKTGPFSLAQLKAKLLSPSTMIWSKKFNHWTKAIEVSELKEHLVPDFEEPNVKLAKVSKPKSVETNKTHISHDKDKTSKITN